VNFAPHKLHVRIKYNHHLDYFASDSALECYREPARIYTQRIGQKYSRPLGLPYGELRDVSATGQLLFTLGEGFIGTLAQAELSGGPWREIVDGVLDAIWLPDNKHIAAARLEDGEMRVELPLGNPIHRLTGKQTRIRLSVDPAGERVAFVDNSLGPLDFCIAERTGKLQHISQNWRVSTRNCSSRMST